MESTTFTNLIITSFYPFPTISLLLPSNLKIKSLNEILSPLVSIPNQTLTTNSGLPLSIYSNKSLSFLHPSTTSTSNSTIKINGKTKINKNDKTVFIRLGVKILGGKGGFASQLRAQGGRMSSNKATNNDSCRDLNGRRLSTIKEAKKIQTYIETEPLRQQALKVASQLKLENLNQEISRLDGGESTGNIKRKLEDNTYIEESREIVEGVRDAVKEAMMKKKKRKLELAAAAASVSINTESTPIASGSGSNLKTIVVEVEAIPIVEEVIESEEVIEEEVVVVKKGKGKGKGKVTKA